MSGERLLLPWLRHYAAVLIALLTVGLVAGAVYAVEGPRDQESAVLLLYQGHALGPLQLPTLAPVVFRSPTVYEPTMRALGMSGPPDTLYERVFVRPVPDTTTILVVGRSRSAPTAAVIASTAAENLVSTFDHLGFQFAVVGEPLPSGIPVGPSRKVILVASALIGLWLGLALSLAHFHIRRPVLTLDRARGIVRPAKLMTIPAPASPVMKWKKMDPHVLEARAGELATENGPSTVEMIIPRDQRTSERRGPDPAGEAILLSRAGSEEAAQAWTVFVCDGGTPELRLRAARDQNGVDGRVGLLWVA
jgi:hypothetical protein